MPLPPGTQVTLVDRPELMETFVDAIDAMTFTNNVLRMDLCCLRLDAASGPKAPTARKVPAARIVMPLDATVELFNQLNQLFAALEKTGAIQREPSGSFIPPSEQKH